MEGGSYVVHDHYGDVQWRIHWKKCTPSSRFGNVPEVASCDVKSRSRLACRDHGVELVISSFDDSSICNLS